VNQFNIPVIDVKDLCHIYLEGTSFEVMSLKNINFQLYDGETIGIVGPTGSGKSTLLHHLNGLLVPGKGEVLIYGKSITDPSINLSEVRQKIALVFQNPEDQLFERYAGDDVAFGPRNLKLTLEEIRNRVNKAIEIVGLDLHFKDRLISELSMGEKRRIAIAGILAMKPDVLVLDEPTAGLDPHGRGMLIDILRRWKSNNNGSIIIASHNMDDIAELSDRVYVLANGEVVLNGYLRDVFSQYDELIKNSLTVTVPSALMRGLIKQGYAVSSNIVTIDEAVREIEGLLNEKKA